MQTSRLQLPLAALILMVAAACGNNSVATSSTTGGGGNGTGNANGTGATGGSGGNASGVSGGNPTGSGGANGTSTGKPPQDPIGTQCSTKGNSDYVSCSTSTDCKCKLLCGLDPVMGIDDAGGSICVMPCTKTSDCPDIWTSCQNGLCTTNVCEADGGGGAFMGPCNAAGEGDGTCEPVIDKTNQEIIGACFQAGTVALPGGNCDPNQAAFLLGWPMGVTPNTKRPNAANLCPIGYQCLATSATTGTCEPLCDPVADMLSDNDAGACAGGASCIAIGSDTVYGGHCIFQGDGGCEVDNGGTEFADCTLDSDCQCPYQCKVDFGSLNHFCAKPCKDTLADCDSPETTCQRGFCNFNYCVEDYLGFPIKDAGVYAGPCNYVDAGDGLCYPGIATDQFGNPTNPFGYCEPAGNAALNAACGPPNCGDGLLCASTGGPSTCFPICDPLLDGGCPGGDGCFSIVPYPLANGTTPQQWFAQQTVGGCINPCSPASTACINSSQCCDGFCDFDLPDAGNGFCN